MLLKLRAATGIFVVRRLGAVMPLHLLHHQPGIAKTDEVPPSAPLRLLHRFDRGQPFGIVVVDGVNDGEGFLVAVSPPNARALTTAVELGVELDRAVDQLAPVVGFHASQFLTPDREASRATVRTALTSGPDRRSAAFVGVVGARSCIPGR